ncbi:MAG: cytochrome c oxidase subunit II [Granulosicoccus sp.]
MNKAVQLLTGLVSAMAVTSANAGGWGINLREGVTDLSHEIYDLHMLVFWVCVIIGVLVFGVMIYSMVHHRASKGHKAATFHESTLAEILWTIAPILVLGFLTVPAAKALIKIEDSSNSDMTIKVTGYQWKWQYEYPEEGISFFSSMSDPSRKASVRDSGIDPNSVEHYLLDVDNPVVIPVGKKVRFLFTSNDVNHAWWVPDLAVKKDAIPGFINDMWANVTEPGTYRGQCAELCGKDHGFMPIVVIAKEQADYDAWVSEQLASAEETKAASEKTWDRDALMAQGEKVYASSCAACHQAGGQGIPGVFPAITGSPTVTGEIGEHLNTIMNGRTGTAMQAYAGQLNDADIAAVTTFQRNGLGNAVGDMVQPADVKALR